MLKPLKALIALSDMSRMYLPLASKNQSVPEVVEEEAQQRNKRRVKIQDGQHYFVVGKSGMGKTYAIRNIIEKKLTVQPYLNVYHVDTKKRGDFSEKDGIVYATEHAPPAFTTAGNRMVWQPVYDDIEEYSKFFLSILNAGLPAIVNVDEAINMRFGTNTIPRGLSILLAQGRLPGIHVIGGTQEVARSPRQMLSQASFILCFNVLNKWDERTMLGYLRKYEKGAKLGLKKFQLWFIRPDIDDVATFHNSIEELLPTII